MARPLKRIAARAPESEISDIPDVSGRVANLPVGPRRLDSGQFALTPEFRARFLADEIYGPADSGAEKRGDALLEAPRDQSPPEF